MRDEGASACSTTNTRPLQGCPAVHHIVPEGSESFYSTSGGTRNNNISAHLSNNRLCVAPHFVRIVELRGTCVCSARAFLFVFVEKSVDLGYAFPRGVAIRGAVLFGGRSYPGGAAIEALAGARATHASAGVART